MKRSLEEREVSKPKQLKLDSRVVYTLFKAAVITVWHHGKQCQDCGTDKEELLVSYGGSQNRRLHERRNTGIINLSLDKLRDELKRTCSVCASCMRQRNSQKPVLATDILSKTGQRSRQKREALRQFVNAEKAKKQCCEECDKAVAVDNLDLFDFVNLPNCSEESVNQMMTAMRSQDKLLAGIQRSRFICVNCHHLQTMRSNQKKRYQDFTPDQIGLAQEYLRGKDMTVNDLRHVFN